MKIGWALDMIGWASCAQPFPTLATPLSVSSSSYRVFTNVTSYTFRVFQTYLLPSCQPCLEGYLPKLSLFCSFSLEFSVLEDISYEWTRFPNIAQLGSAEIEPSKNRCIQLLQPAKVPLCVCHVTTTFIS